MAQYDIFISYKRRGASKAVSANIYSFLTQRGYSVFFDREEMKSGKFNEQLYANIETAKDIIILLEEGSLKSIYNGIKEDNENDSYKTDWFCMEIMHAIAMHNQDNQKRIIPILIDGYKMPGEKDLPPEMKDLSVLNAIEYDSGLSFKDVFEEYLIQRQFLTSKSRRKNEDGIADFLFYSDVECEVYERGEVVFNLDHNDEDHPYCYSVKRSGEHRFTCFNYETCERIKISEVIEANSQKYIQLNWEKTQNLWKLTEDDIKRQSDVATLFFWGDGLFHGNKKKQPNYDMSLKCFEKLINFGVDEAKLYVRRNFKESWVKEITPASIEWIKSATLLGEPSAYYLLGVCYQFEYGGLSKDLKKAFDCYSVAAEAGHELAWCRLGALYEKGLGCEKNYAKAFRFYSKAADNNNAWALSLLGALYEFGYGVEKDNAKAFSLYKHSADLNYPSAQCKLGFYYEEGETVEQDLSEAFRYFSKAADQDDKIAVCRLGMYYEQGIYVDQDINKALEMYRKSADLGEASAQRKLGYFYEEGEVVEQNFQTAYEWFSKSAKQNDEEAINKVAQYLEKGLVV